MKYKKYISWLICALALISYLEIKHLSKPEDKPAASGTETVVNEPDKQVNSNKDIISSGGETTLENKPKKIDITMLDTISNTVGNSSGNLVNEGLAAKQGKWMYFTLQTENRLYPIYRAMLDGETALKRLTDPGLYKFINVVGDWVYYYDVGYHSICKVKTDGSEKRQLSEKVTNTLVVMGDWIYYSTQTLGISKMKTDGTNDTLIIKDQTVNGYFNITNDSIYYTTGSPDQHTLYKANIDGSNKSRFADVLCYLTIIEDDWIYYMDAGNGLYLRRIKTDGTSKTKITDIPIGRYNVSGNKIYYVPRDDAQNIYLMDLDGRNKIKITNNPNSINTQQHLIGWIDYLNIIDDTIFASVFADRLGFVSYKAKTDGSLDKFLN